MASMVMFGLIYLLLGVLWVFVLNKKIQAGPQPPSRTGEEPGGLLDAAGSLVGHTDSMTETGGN
jgi:hypothetical protein